MAKNSSFGPLNAYLWLLSHHLWPLKPLNNTSLHSPISACWSTGGWTNSLGAPMLWGNNNRTPESHLGSSALLNLQPLHNVGCTLGSCTDHWCLLLSAKAQLQQRVYREEYTLYWHGKNRLNLSCDKQNHGRGAWGWGGGVLLWGMKFVVGLWIKANHNQSSILKFPHKKSSRPLECKCFMLCVGVGTWGWRPREPVERLQRARCCRKTFEMMGLVWMDDLCLLSDHPLAMPALQSPHCTSISPLCTVFLWSPASASLHQPLLSFHCSPSVSFSSSFSPAVYLAVFLGRWTGGFDPSDAAHFPLCLPLRVYSWLSSL